MVNPSSANLRHPQSGAILSKIAYCKCKIDLYCWQRLSVPWVKMFKDYDSRPSIWGGVVAVACYLGLTSMFALSPHIGAGMNAANDRDVGARSYHLTTASRRACSQALSAYVKSGKSETASADLPSSDATIICSVVAPSH